MANPNDKANGAHMCNIEEVRWQTFERGEQYQTRYQDLSAHVGAKQISLSHEILEPGKTATGFHFHVLNEEHVLILDGEAVLVFGETRYKLSKGDYVCFLAGDQRGHLLKNESMQLCRYLAIGSPHPYDTVVFPQENRVVVKSLHKTFALDSSLPAWNDLLNAGGTTSNPDADR